MCRQDVQIKRVLDQCETEKAFERFPGWTFATLLWCFIPNKNLFSHKKSMYFFLSVENKRDCKVKIGSCSRYVFFPLLLFTLVKTSF